MPHWMDINNPHRDLSDPNWISAGAWHHEQKKRIAEFKARRELREKEIPKKLKAFYFDGNENFEFIEIYCESLECEMCQKKGAYYIENGDGIGACMTHLKEQYDRVEAVQE